jgi:mannose-6-phosphate isomerase-like protein (cupin superfamily)
MPLPQLSSSAHPLELPLEPDTESGWKIYYAFRGKTASLRSLSTHASVLSSGHSAHPPHSHPGEELCVLVEGKIELIFPAEGAVPLEPGEAMLIGADVEHGIRSTGEVPAVYLIIRWLADPVRGKPSGGFTHKKLDLSAPPAATDVEVRPLHGAATDYLQTLRCELVTLAAGASHGPPVAEHDALLLALEGELESAGGNARPYGLAIVRAGGSGAAANRGTSPAVYLRLAFEPHPASAAQKVVNSALWYSRRTVLRRPMRVAG